MTVVTVVDAMDRPWKSVDGAGVSAYTWYEAGIPYYAVVRAEEWAGNLSAASIEVSAVPNP